MSMEFFTRYRVQQFETWVIVDKFLGKLPPKQFEQAMMLKTQLAIGYSETGRAADIFTRSHDYPLFYIHRWLVDDWQIQEATQRQHLEQHLPPAITYAVAAAFLQSRVLYPDNVFDESFLGLVDSLWQEARYHLDALLPVESRLWQNYPYLAQGSEDSVTTEWAAPQLCRLAAAVTATMTNHEDDLPPTLTLLDALASAIELVHQLLSVRRDIYQARQTQLIECLVAKAGGAPGEVPDPQQLLGTLVLYRIGQQVCREAVTHLERGKLLAKQLALPTFRQYINHWQRLVHRLDTFLTTGKTPSPVPAFLPVTHALKETIAAAAGYLLSDQTFQAAWEMQRGLLPSRALTARAFPTGLVVENLYCAGHMLPEAIDRVYTWLQESNFRYYEDYAGLPPDADDLGLLLRLYRFAPQERQPAYRRLLALPLQWMEQSIRPDGEIPVWFGTMAAQNASSKPKVWGPRCATTEINLLMGLLDFDPGHYQAICDASGANLMARFEQSGLGASLYYGPAYTTWAAFRFFQRLGHYKQTHPELPTYFLEQFSHIARQWSTPQTAAFLLLTEPAHAETGFDVTRWVSRLLKRQRHDGSWEAEPLFLTPHRMGTTWYASRLVTSAYCYLALKQLA
jgi:hypothetical protein